MKNVRVISVFSFFGVCLCLWFLGRHMKRMTTNIRNQTLFFF